MANQYRSILAGGAATGGDALPANVLSGKTFTNDNGPQTGTMVDNGAVTATAPYTIPEGYHNGNGTVSAPIPQLKKVSYSGSLNSPITINIPDDITGYTTSDFIASGRASISISGDHNISVGAGVIQSVDTENQTVTISAFMTGYNVSGTVSGEIAYVI